MSLEYHDLNFEITLEAYIYNKQLIMNLPVIVVLYPHKEPYSAPINQPLWPRKKNVRGITAKVTQFLNRTESEVENKHQTFSNLKRSPRGGRPSRMVRVKYSVERACLKNGCFKSFSEVGRFFGSFTKQVPTISLKDWK